jgi:acyl-CoA dehydrogenase
MSGQDSTEEDSTLLFDTAQRVFSEYCGPAVLAAAEARVFPSQLWAHLAGIGLLDMLRPESDGGVQAAPSVFAGVMRIAGRFAAPAPIAETMIARCILAQVDHAQWSDHALLAIEGWQYTQGRLTGTVRQSNDPPAVLIIHDDPKSTFLAVVPFDEFQSGARRNIAGEHLLELSIERNRVMQSAVQVDPSLHRLAEHYLSLARAALIVGATETAMQLSLTYAVDRVQFGRSIGKFQAVQQLLACLAGAVAASSAITMAAARAMDRGGGEVLLEAARIRLGDAVDSVAAITHQVHGAIGFTQEYQLQYFTRRLMAWRDEGAPTAGVRQRFAARFAHCAADELWPTLIGSTTRVA